MSEQESRSRHGRREAREWGVWEGETQACVLENGGMWGE